MEFHRQHVRLVNTGYVLDAKLNRATRAVAENGVANVLVRVGNVVNAVAAKTAANAAVAKIVANAVAKVVVWIALAKRETDVCARAVKVNIHARNRAPSVADVKAVWTAKIRAKTVSNRP